MRISDWSSDVCSSDLIYGRPITMFWPQIISICLKRGKQGQPGLRRRAIASRSLLVMLKFDGKAVAAALCSASAAFLPLGVHAQSVVGTHADLVRSEELRIGIGCVSSGKCRWAPHK